MNHPFTFFAIGIGIIVLITFFQYFLRLVKAVERIADKIDPEVHKDH